MTQKHSDLFTEVIVLCSGLNCPHSLDCGIPFLYSSRGIIGDRDGQQYPDGRHGGPERHSRDSGSQRESWGGSGGGGGYGPGMKRVGDNRGGVLPQQSRDRDWSSEHGRKIESHPERSWQGSMDGGMMGRDHDRWQGMEDLCKGATSRVFNR